MATSNGEKAVLLFQRAFSGVSLVRFAVILAAFSLLFSLSCVAGGVIVQSEEVSAVAALRWLGFSVVAAAFRLLSVFLAERKGGSDDAGKWHPLALSFAVIWLCYLFFFLLYYPGCTSTDSDDVLKMALGLPFESDHFRYDSLNNHHPVAFVALVSLFTRLGAAVADVEFGVALYSLFQMTAVALACAYCARWVYRRSGRKAAFFACLVFFVLNPLIARYAVTLWKDVLFAAALLVFSIASFEVLRTRGRWLTEKRHAVLYGAALILTVLFRNNGIFVVATLLLCWRDGRKKAIFGIGGGCLAFVLVFQTIGFGVLDVSSGHFSESVSIPLQQMARSIVEEGKITDEQADFIQNILPLDRIEELYRPDTPNALKFAPDFNDEFLDGHKVEFLLVWFQMMPANAESYLAAWLNETVGYWYVGMESWLVTDPGYFLSEPSQAVPGHSLLPFEVGPDSIFHGYRPTDILQEAVPPLCNAASLSWLAVFALVVQVCFRRKMTVGALVPFVVFWATFLIAAPISNEFRYFFALHLAVPFVLACLLWPIDEGVRSLGKEAAPNAVRAGGAA